MTGIAWLLNPVGPAEMVRRFLADEPGRAALELVCGRRLRRKAVDELWRLWPTLPPPQKNRARDLCWRSGITNRLVAAAAKRTGAVRRSALQRLAALADGRTLAPLLSLWLRFSGEEREIVLALAAKVDHPGLAGLLWREVARHAPDPPGEMARLASSIGLHFYLSLDLILREPGAPVWVWETLIRLRGREAEERMVGCLGRRDALGERARRWFATSPGERALPPLMEAARRHPSWDVRLDAVTVLLGRKEPQALRFLTGLLRDPDWYTGTKAGDCSWPAIFGLTTGRNTH
ncbi:MAG: HEAT repeat domain-containing protein [Bacteroidota bacterium]